MRPETMAGGVAVFDANNDGYPDIFFTNGADIVSLKKTGPRYSNRLFLNDGHGHFTDATEKAGLAGTGYDIGVAIGDYDNDGYQDIFVGGVHHNTLYHNNGDGTFTDVTEKAGLGGSSADSDGPLWSVGGAWVDLNNDGLLDLVVVNYLRWDAANEPVCNYKETREYCHPRFYKRSPSQVFLNLGNGKFQRRLSKRVRNGRAPRQRNGHRRGGFRPRRPHGHLHRLRQGLQPVLPQPVLRRQRAPGGGRV
jgi:hypothetical protein